MSSLKIHLPKGEPVDQLEQRLSEFVKYTPVVGQPLVKANGEMRQGFINYQDYQTAKQVFDFLNTQVAAFWQHPKVKLFEPQDPVGPRNRRDQDSGELYVAVIQSDISQIPFQTVVKQIHSYFRSQFPDLKIVDSFPDCEAIVIRTTGAFQRCLGEMILPSRIKGVIHEMKNYESSFSYQLPPTVDVPDDFWTHWWERDERKQFIKTTEKKNDVKIRTLEARSTLKVRGDCTNVLRAIKELMEYFVIKTKSLNCDVQNLPSVDDFELDELCSDFEVLFQVVQSSKKIIFFGDEYSKFGMAKDKMFKLLGGQVNTISYPQGGYPQGFIYFLNRMKYFSIWKSNYNVSFPGLNWGANPSFKKRVTLNIEGDNKEQVKAIIDKLFESWIVSEPIPNHGFKPIVYSCFLKYMSPRLKQLSQTDQDQVLIFHNLSNKNGKKENFLTVSGRKEQVELIVQILKTKALKKRFFKRNDQNQNGNSADDDNNPDYNNRKNNRKNNSSSNENNNNESDNNNYNSNNKRTFNNNRNNNQKNSNSNNNRNNKMNNHNNYENNQNLRNTDDGDPRQVQNGVIWINNVNNPIPDVMLKKVQQMGTHVFYLRSKRTLVLESLLQECLDKANMFLSANILETEIKVKFSRHEKRFLEAKCSGNTEIVGVYFPVKSNEVIIKGLKKQVDITHRELQKILSKTFQEKIDVNFSVNWDLEWSKLANHYIKQKLPDEIYFNLITNASGFELNLLAEALEDVNDAISLVNQESHEYGQFERTMKTSVIPKTKEDWKRIQDLGGYMKVKKEQDSNNNHIFRVKALRKADIDEFENSIRENEWVKKTFDHKTFGWVVWKIINSTEFQTIRKGLASIGVKIDWLPKKSLTLRGPKSKINDATKFLENVKEGILQKVVTQTQVVPPELFGVYCNKKFKLSFDAIQWGLDVWSSSDHVKRLVRDVDGFPNGLRFQVRFGNILDDEEIDAIINPVNEKATEGGGLAQQILQEGGDQFRNEVQQLLGQKGTLPIGSAHFIKTDGLKMKKIVLTVPPVYQTPKSLDALRQAYVQSFEVVDQIPGCHIVGVPLLGAGGFQFPADVSSRIGLEAFLSWVGSKKPKNVQVVRFCEIERKPLLELTKVVDRKCSEDSLQVNVRKWKLPPAQKLEMGKPQFQFYFQDGGLKPYDNDSNTVLNTAYQNFLQNPKNHTEISLGHIQHSDSKFGKAYTVNFEKKTQLNLASGFERKITWQQINNSTANAQDEEEEEEGDDGTDEIDLDEESFGVLSLTFSGYPESMGNIPLFITLLQNEMVTEPLKVELEPQGLAHINKKRVAQKLYSSVQETNQGLLIKGANEFVKDVKSLIFEYLSNKPTNTFQFPQHWDTPKQKVDVINLSPSSPEWKEVQTAFNLTLPSSKVLLIQRIQNYRMWKSVVFNREKIEEVNGRPPVIEKLFHGTRNTDPSLIYEPHDGFCMNFSAQGMWGRGTYFAVKSAYSNGYAFTNSSGQKQIFYCEVTVGDSVTLKSDSSIVIPPFKDQVSKVRYDSVNGETGGSKVFIVYENQRAYPNYLITYQ